MQVEGWPPFGVSYMASPLPGFMNLSQENDNFFKIARGLKKIGQCSMIVGG